MRVFTVIPPSWVFPADCLLTSPARQLRTQSDTLDPSGVNSRSRLPVRILQGNSTQSARVQRCNASRNAPTIQIQKRAVSLHRSNTMHACTTTSLRRRFPCDCLLLRFLNRKAKNEACTIAWTRVTIWEKFKEATDSGRDLANVGHRNKRQKENPVLFLVEYALFPTSLASRGGHKPLTTNASRYCPPFETAGGEPDGHPDSWSALTWELQNADTERGTNDAKGRRDTARLHGATDYN